MHNFTKSSLAVLVAALAACGGGGGGSSTTTPVTPLPTNLMAGGIWQGTLIQNGQAIPLLALLSDNGGRIIEAPTVAPARTQVVVINPGDLQGTDGQYTSTNDGGAAEALDYADGLDFLLQLKLTVVPRTSITGSYFNPDGGGSDTFTLSFDAADYDQPSSLAIIAGTYRYSGTGNCCVVTIDAAGNFSATDPPSFTTTITGTVSVINPAFNLYNLQATGPYENYFSQNFAGVLTHTPGQPALLTMALNSVAAAAGDRFQTFYWVAQAQ